MYYQNYHKHTSLSHRYNKDSSLIPQDYFNAMKPLADKGIPQIYSTVEHGWQGNYFHIYDDLEKFNKDCAKENENFKPIKFIFGVEAYWVDNHKDKDASNNHIILLAKNDNGRKALNNAIAKSFVSQEQLDKGVAQKMFPELSDDDVYYYYKNRMDIDLLLSLPSDDVFVTTACIAFWLKYSDDCTHWEHIDEDVLKLNAHFKDFYLEVQANNTDKQKKINAHILELHKKYGIPIISATDSHELTMKQMQDREYLLESNKISYPDEDGNYMDFPSVEMLQQRYKEQGVLSENEYNEAIENTNKILDFEDIILDRSLKVPVIKSLRNKTQEERNEIFKQILIKEWNNHKNDINQDMIDEYKKEIKHDYKEIIDCGMADYFIDDYYIVERGQKKYNGVLTPSGRGSAVSMFLNYLLNLTKVDKVNAPVTMYSERFLTATRIKESHTPPDIDCNVSSREPFIQAQKDLIGENGTFDLLAIGKLKYKSAFKMYARANKLLPTIQNNITKQIDKYETALKHKSDDETEDDYNIYDYVDEKYRPLIDGCQKYRGIVDTLKSHPCFTKEALVMTSKGYKHINEVTTDDYVIGIDNDYHKVVQVMERTTDDIYRLSVGGSMPIEVTGNHPFFTAKKFHQKGEKKAINCQWKEVKDLTKDDIVAFAINQKSILPQLDFVDSTNKNFWWSLGRYFGDGWRSHTVRRSGRNKGALVKDVIICCNKKNNDTNIITSHLDWCDYRVSENNTTNKIYLKCKGLYQWLEQFGDKAIGKHFTNIIYDLPVDYLKVFLNGYLSADGHVGKTRKEQHLTTINEQLAYGVMFCVFKAFHRPCTITKSKTNDIEYIQGRKVHTHQRFNISFTYDKRKQDKYFYDGKYIWCNVRGVEKIDKTDKVYNLEVADTHTYTVNNIIVHNCGCSAYSGNAITDIGVIMVKSESTKKEVWVALQESSTIDAFGYLKNDWLIVDSIGLTYDIYKEIGMQPMTVNQLLKKIDNDKSTWDIYTKGYTMCINQVEQKKSTEKVMRFKPKNIYELCQFVAAIRPSFQSMYNIFEARKHFDYGIKTFDNILQDKYCTSSFIIYQEDLMKVLGFAGFPMGETYTIIKAISKKKKYVIDSAKPKFIKNFAQAILDTGETSSQETAHEMATKVWTIIENSASYGFNCVSGDTKLFGHQKTVAQMYDDFQNHKITSYGTALSMKDGKLKRNKIIDIYKQGLAETFCLVTESGRRIIATKNHKFPIPKGKKTLWGTLWGLDIGDRIYVMSKDLCNVHTERIVTISHWSYETVYDVSMSDDVSHTFVTDEGIVTSNCSHSYCMAIDSVTLAWLKAHYPYEFYKVTLQRYTDKGDKDKVTALKQEMGKLNIPLKPVKFGDDNRAFNISPTHDYISQTMVSLKGIQKIVPDIMYDLGQKHYDSFLDVLEAINKTKVNKTSLDILIKIDYFCDYGDINQLLYQRDMYVEYMSKKVITKARLTNEQIKIFKLFVEKETAKQFRDIDNQALIEYLIRHNHIEPITEIQKIAYEVQYMGYSDKVIKNIGKKGTKYADYSKFCSIVVDIDEDKYGRHFVTLYELKHGDTKVFRCNKSWWYEHNDIEQGDIIEPIFNKLPQKVLNDEGHWVNSKTETYWELSMWSKVE